jgi:hypothetical protein
MKYLIALAALTASFAAHADDAMSLVSADGLTTITPLAGTARAYKNAKGVAQVDMLFQEERKYVKDGDSHMKRERLAFTGCAKGQGLVYSVSPEGHASPLAASEWVRGGPTMIDGMAVIACKAAH